MYGLWPVPFKDGCAVASMNMSTKYEVILLTSEGPKVRCKWEDGTEFSRRLLKPRSFHNERSRGFKNP
jgi:hypothetical protein